MSGHRCQASDPIAAMTPQEKLRAAQQLYWSARALKEAALRYEHPDWSDAQIARAVRTAFLLHRE